MMATFGRKLDCLLVMSALLAACTGTINDTGCQVPAGEEPSSDPPIRPVDPPDDPPSDEESGELPDPPDWDDLPDPDFPPAPAGDFTLYHPVAHQLGQGGVLHPIITWGNGTGATPMVYAALVST